MALGAAEVFWEDVDTQVAVYFDSLFRLEFDFLSYLIRGLFPRGTHASRVFSLVARRIVVVVCVVLRAG